MAVMLWMTARKLTAGLVESNGFMDK